MVLYVILSISILAIFYYRRNFFKNQIETIKSMLHNDAAAKYEQINCSIYDNLSYTQQYFDIYKTSKYIVLIRNYGSIIQSKFREKTAETYLLIIDENLDTFPKELFLNYMSVSKMEPKIDGLLITGELYNKSPFGANFVYNSNTHIKINGLI